MQFKIDTKEFYSQITPITNHLDANLTGALHEKWYDLSQNGVRNLLIDLHNCLDADSTSFAGLLKLHEQVYSNAGSLVFTNVPDAVLQTLKQESADTLLNITPTPAEAIDIISMEILERDLFDEES